MKRRDKILIFLAVLLLAIFLFYMLYLGSIKETKEIDMDLLVSSSKNVIGFNPEGDALHFGAVPGGGKSTREFVLENNNTYSLKVRITSIGNISSFLLISDNNFILNPSETRTIETTVNVHSKAKPGNYVGTLQVQLHKPLIF